MTFQVIQQLESDNSSLFKQSVIKENLDNEEFILGAKMCLDPFFGDFFYSRIF